MLTGYRFVFPLEVRFRDLDALRHVNNAVYLTYLESARLAFWQRLTGRSGLAAFDMILARVEVDYRSPARFGDQLEVGVRCESLRRSSFVLESAIVERGSGRLVAEARKVLVCYDHAAGRSQPIPDALPRGSWPRARKPGSRVRDDGLAQGHLSGGGEGHPARTGGERDRGEAVEWPADLVVVGAHGRSRAERIFLGSLSEGVVNALPSSVLVVRGLGPGAGTK